MLSFCVVCVFQWFTPFSFFDEAFRFIVLYTRSNFIDEISRLSRYPRLNQALYHLHRHLLWCDALL